MAGADRICQSLADGNGVGYKTWRAHLSVERDAGNGNRPTDARSRIGSGPWVNANGVLVARGLAALHSRTGEATVFVDESGRPINGQWEPELRQYGPARRRRAHLLLREKLTAAASPGTDSMSQFTNPASSTPAETFHEGLDLFLSLGRSNLRLWEGLTPTDLERVGLHSERGEESLAHMRRLYAAHDLMHLRHLDRIRASLASRAPNH